jgi:hypothetical protein
VAKGQGGRLDLPGNILFAAGLIAVLAGIIYALRHRRDDRRRPHVRAAHAAPGELRLPLVRVAAAVQRPVRRGEHIRLGPSLRTLSPARQATVTGHAFFPGLISGPFHHGLAIVFTFALIMCLIAAAASWLRGSAVRRASTEEFALRAVWRGRVRRLARPEPKAAPCGGMNPVG